MSHHRHAQFVIDMPASDATFAEASNKTAEWLDRALFYGLIAMLVFSPLAFGTTQPWSQFVERSMALVLLGLWAARQYFKNEIELGANPLLLPSLLFLALVVIQLLAGITGYRYATLVEALNLIPIGGVILIAGDTFTRRRKLHDFVDVMAVFGFGVAFFALVQDLSNADKIYWLAPVHELSAALYGPYANHNHYAGLMEMLVPLCGTAAFLERGAKRGLLLFATVIMAVSIVFSRSRGGILGLCIALIFVCAILFKVSRNHRAALAIMAIATVIVVLVLLLANDKILQRLTETQDNYRLAIYRDCFRMWLHKPILGFGFGAFPTVYPEYRSFFTNLRVNHAHNDYLELLVETGVIGVGLTAWFLFGVFRGGFRKIFDRNDHDGSVLAVGVVTAIVALLAHSALDFNLHIPANAALFYVLCAAAATPFRHRVREVVFPPSEDDIEPEMVDTPA